MKEEKVTKKENRERTQEAKTNARISALPEYPNYVARALQIVRGCLSEKQKRKALASFHPKVLAEALESLLPGERKHLYRLLDEEIVSEVFSFLDDPATYMQEMDDQQAAQLLAGMDIADASYAWKGLDVQRQKTVRSRMDSTSRQEMDLLQSYAEDEFGSIMTTNCIRIPRGATVKQAMRCLTRQAGENDNIDTIYVVEKNGILYGALTLQRLLIAREGDDLEQIITTSYPYVYDHEKLSERVEDLRDYNEDSVPVLDRTHRMIGIVTTQALAEVIERLIGEDYAQLAGLTTSEDLHEPLRDSLRKRIPWLLVLLALSMLVSTVTGLFEGVMAQLSVLVAFQSLVLDMAGNVGTQSLAVSIRVLAGGELQREEKFRLARKEIRLGSVIGLIMGALSCGLVVVYLHWIAHYAVFFSLAVGLCLGVAMLVSMLVSSLTGTAIPLALQSAGVDPAVASGPMITTVNDLVAVVSYYGLAMWWLIGVLHMG